MDTKSFKVYQDHVGGENMDEQETLGDMERFETEMVLAEMAGSIAVDFDARVPDPWTAESGVVQVGKVIFTIGAEVGTRREFMEA